MKYTGESDNPQYSNGVDGITTLKRAYGLKYNCEKCRWAYEDSFGQKNVRDCKPTRKKAGVDYNECLGKYFAPALKIGSKVRISKDFMVAFFDKFPGSRERLSLHYTIFEIRESLHDNECRIFIQKNKLDENWWNIPTHWIYEVDKETTVNINIGVGKMSENVFKSIRTGSGYAEGGVAGEGAGLLYQRVFLETPAKKPAHFHKYEFKAQKLDLSMIVDSAIEDKKRSFIVMNKNDKTATVGLLKNTRLFIKDIEGIKNVFAIGGPYHIFEVEKSNVNQFVKFLKQERIDFEKKQKKHSRKLKKQIQKNKQNKIKNNRFQVFTF